MLETIKKPVKIYRSTDKDAPQMSANVNNSVKTILKACLVTGFGEGETRKESLGWSMPVEEHDDTESIFISNDNTSSQYSFWINDKKGKLWVMPLESSSLTEEGELKKIGKAVGGRVPVTSNTEWIMIGHAGGFLFVYSVNSYQVGFFGVLDGIGLDGGKLPLFLASIVTDSSKNYFPFESANISRSNEDLNGSQKGVSKIYNCESGLSCYFNSLYSSGEFPPVNQENGFLETGEVYITQKNGSHRYKTVGILPHVRMVGNYIPSMPQLSVISDVEKTGFNWLLINFTGYPDINIVSNNIQAYYQPFVVNMQEWSVPV